MQKSHELKRFLNILERAGSLKELYLRALPFFFEICNIDKILFFKFSKRKNCFDPKLAVKKSEALKIIKDDYENFDVDKLFESEFNKKFRILGVKCNDTVRALVGLFVDKKVKIINFNNIAGTQLKNVLREFGFKREILSVPFVSLGEIVGFMLIDICEIEHVRCYVGAFSCALGRLLLIKSLNNLTNIIETQKEELNRTDIVCQIGKTALTIAHEMKNSLVGIIGLFGKLKDKLGEDEKAVKYYQIIDKELKKLYDFTLDINKFSKIVKPREFQPVDIEDIIDNSIEMVSAFAKDVSFSVSIDENVSQVLADKTQLEQVFLNLFKNSIEAGKGRHKVKIDVSVRLENNNVVIRIKDNSGGVDEETLRSMLKPFFTTKSYGTGLGLSIVKGIVDNHNGELFFRNVDGGLECVIRLPLNLGGGENGR
ncbi:sensor histidine kinase [Hippea maritima]|uniref:histidine kinase n=1 Tax=Hippea maritima (strain ATCC 700847 / DSM 10411 / MH2) TaxID=760142 RepID=F2LTQ0_HIPMA|nr:HAMP domain-containing sensor histidine kinase [Hippea maritima]AEA34426.1 histidine kinase [Hippea maritima DSM 10411]